jgi:hypothetical protein
MTCLKEAFTEQYVPRCETSPLGTRLINFWATGNGLTSPDIVKCCPDVSRDTDDNNDDDDYYDYDDNVVSVGVPCRDWLLNLHATCTVCLEFLVLYKCL